MLIEDYLCCQVSRHDQQTLRTISTLCYLPSLLLDMSTAPLPMMCPEGQGRLCRSYHRAQGLSLWFVAADLPAVIKTIPVVASEVQYTAGQIDYSLSPIVQCDCESCPGVRWLLTNPFYCNCSFALSEEAAQHMSRYLVAHAVYEAHDQNTGCMTGKLVCKRMQP